MRRCVFKNGAIAYSRGYGMASLEHDVPIANPVFYAGSVSKQFTAMAVALASSREARVRRFDPQVLPSCRVCGPPSRISNLLHHTSGLRDYNTLLRLPAGATRTPGKRVVLRSRRSRRSSIPSRARRVRIFEHRLTPCSRSSSRRATGTKFAAFADAISSSRSAWRVTPTTRRTAPRSSPGAGVRRPDASGRWIRRSTSAPGAGRHLHEHPDLLKWDENFYTGKVGGADVLKTIQTQGKLNDGKTLAYAWGLQIGRVPGQPIVEHSGSLGGYAGALIRFPSQTHIVALLCKLERHCADRSFAPGRGGGSCRHVVSQPSRRPRRAGAAARVHRRPPATMPPEVPRGLRRHVREWRDRQHVTSRSTGSTDVEARDDSRARGVSRAPPPTIRARGLTIRFQRDAAKTVIALTSMRG